MEVTVMGQSCSFWYLRQADDQYGNHGPVNWVFTLRKATRLFSASALFCVSSSNLKTQHFKWCRDYPEILKGMTEKRGRTPLLSKVTSGHQLAKSFLDQFVNSLSRKKDFGSVPTGISGCSFLLMWLQFNKVVCSHLGYVHSLQWWDKNHSTPATNARILIKRDISFIYIFFI